MSRLIESGARFGLFVLWGVLLVPFVAVALLHRARVSGGTSVRWPGVESGAAPALVSRARRTLHPTLRALRVPCPDRALPHNNSRTQGHFQHGRHAPLVYCCFACGSAAFLGSPVFFKGKSGWCSSFCPLLPVQRVYGQTPFVVVRNSHCKPLRGLREELLRLQPVRRAARRPLRRGSVSRRIPEDLRWSAAGARTRLLHSRRSIRVAHRRDVRHVRPLHPRRHR